MAQARWEFGPDKKAPVRRSGDGRLNLDLPARRPIVAGLDVDEVYASGFRPRAPVQLNMLTGLRAEQSDKTLPHVPGWPIPIRSAN